MTTEIDTRRNQIRELANRMFVADRTRIESILQEPADLIKNMIGERVKEMIELDCFPAEEVYILTEGFRVIDGASISTPDFTREKTERPFVSRDGKLYICPDGLEPGERKVINWSERREASPKEYVQYGSEVFVRLSRAIDYYFNPVDVYAVGEGF